MELQLKISGLHHEILKEHLLTADKREAVAVGLCGRHISENKIILTLHDLTLIPHDECYTRGTDILIWPTNRISHYFERLGKSDLSILKIHSHPGGYNKFSSTDDNSDKEFFDSAFGWSINNKPHVSAVMLPSGEIFGRFFFEDLHHKPIDKILIAGDQIQLFFPDTEPYNHAFAKRTIQAFGEKTYAALHKMTVGVIGCSGTGSPLIEQLVRLGVGKLVLIDPDTVEYKNLNRILNTTITHAEHQTPKVTVMKDIIYAIGLGTEVITYQENVYNSSEAIKTLIGCDIIFGCVDSVDGRYLLNQLSTFYLIPYFDIGVKLEADGHGGIEKICASVHYIQPGKSSLITRGQYSTEDLRAASQFRKNPEEYKNLQKNSYIKNINVNNPAVISVNMHIASHAINEFLNRIHPFKMETSNNYAISTIDITGGYIVNVNEAELPPDNYLRNKIGRGDVLPFIDIPELKI